MSSTSYGRLKLRGQGQKGSIKHTLSEYRYEFLVTFTRSVLCVTLCEPQYKKDYCTWLLLGIAQAHETQDSYHLCSRHLACSCAEHISLEPNLVWARAFAHPFCTIYVYLFKWYFSTLKYATDFKYKTELFLTSRTFSVASKFYFCKL